jgi:hypothetical protein
MRPVEYVDSLACRVLEEIRDKGWITMKKGVNTVLFDP